MDPKKNNNKRGGKRGSNWRGLLSLVSWALLLTVIFSYAGDFMTGTVRHADSVELNYGEYLDMVETGQVSGVGFDNEEDILVIFPTDGYTYINEEDVKYVYSSAEETYTVYVRDAETKEYVLKQNTKPVALELFTVQVESNGDQP